MSLSLIPGIEVSGSALDAERQRLNVIANNIANAQTTRDNEGKVYRRQLVVFESMLAQENQSSATAVGSASSSPNTVKVREIVEDTRPLKSIYMPGHPDANAEGMVQMPNVNVAEEMVDMITASRAIEANVQIITTAKQMVQRVLEIGKR
ncbi:MAG: flagellar basal body rod protein FlgC [Verrucomicrobia bacterium]|nr:flagellar basal body rod protein FlgC [Verrucomicrobiota bacterium]